MRQLELSFKSYKKAALCIGAALLFFSCEESKTDDLGKINRNFADRTTINAHVIHKDSGVVRLDLKTPLIEEYTLIDSPYTLMRKGLDLTFYNQKLEPNFLRADWAKIQQKTKFYEGKGNVVMINNEGDTLKTQKIFWDSQNRKIYTHDTVTIARADGTRIISENGLEGSEDFKQFTFFKNHGVINAEQKNQKKSTQSPASGQAIDKNILPLETKTKEIQD
ncbi:LPS export ABC transporter periplasmic protein LptC [Ornithobacterium rhinotracheale]|uniref:LPS export ABC transporter periplasmic protein LptC n=1 Tax=Ornithobacterium rhinotracheale (strain ATCC 51463 / DSM 15997 / CCUG 23171 / CIP 104009 / LMG 9086) TaxID=867902 RepID=I4A042_ORNRL|nr:LPS export ABC transporter periplasmic protein LptC [Ornithobacterium rhinotracheale]AFL97326.1 Protein of unknown function (DUF1239) [Ornithobacterium rhinotracheale DSM 15997]AIP99370.1 hypothetical protein Q785_06310 [Ornithobacterium rhinotracheale ORT-UMN 88]KGB67511.1 hypothetical protein Q787_05805 [Ornithobacterium rhinotracheale H06-030791]MBN3663054.1 LPS export ABC transporter periplasmic protein LptC [Ornithobacterium rhinotracheale]MCK0194215.1 LPS export ABC transporter peripl